MAPGSNKYDSVLWKIARNPEISPDACWEELETWLESYKVEIKSQNADDWVKSLDRIRRKIDGIKNSASATRSPRSTRSPSTESDRQPDNDSGYGPSDKVRCCDLHDQTLSIQLANPCLQSDQLEVVFILAGGIETYPDGKVPLTCCYSDKYDEDYITDEACKRIGNPRIGRDGKVTLPYILSSETKSAEGIFAVIKYDDGEADVGFKIKGTEETPEAPVEERDGDLVLGIMHPLVGM
jgi:hypothetical protein